MTDHRLPGPALALLLVLPALAGCQNLNRAMIFSTGTTIGLEVSTSPASDTPVQLVFGLKRTEVLIDPVLSGENADTIEPRAHSVLAKLAGRVDRGSATPAGGSTTMSGGQWFASGRAAEILADHPATAAALTDNPAIAAAIAESARQTYGPLPSLDASAIQTELLLSYLETDPRDEAELARFDAAAQAQGFDDFTDFIFANPTLEQATAVREALR
ncbi:MAG: hypothetical protein AAGH88_09595 [Planctomycetota bacterium]